VFGGSGDDTIYGGEGDDGIVGMLGNDTLYGKAGDDWLFGDDLTGALAGRDLLYGDVGDDRIVAGGENDIAYGGGGIDIINLAAGNDYAFGGWGNDSIDGGDGDDRLYGGEGDDTISGYLGNDLIAGNNGNDKLNGGRAHSPEEYMEIDTFVPRAQALALAVLRVLPAHGAREPSEQVWKRGFDEIASLAAQLMRECDSGAAIGGDFIAVAMPATRLSGAKRTALRIAAVAECTAFASGEGGAGPLVFEQSAVELQPGESGTGMLARALRALDAESIPA